MPSLVTDIIGGIQGASAAHNAAKASAGGYNQAGSTMGTYQNAANEGLAGAANAAVTYGTDAARHAQDLATAAGTAAQTGITTATGTANDYLNPYISTGNTANAALAQMVAPGGYLSTPMTADEIMKQDPGYQFQLQQGLQATERAAAAQGATGGGGLLKAIANYTTNQAQSGYQQAFNNTQTLQNNTFARLMQLANAGQTAATQAGSNEIQGAQYAGNAGMQTGEYAGSAGMQGNEYAGNALLNTATTMSGNRMLAGQYIGNTQIGAGNAIAAGDIGAANAWNGMLGGIGTAANTALIGGLGGGAGWNWTGALTGNPYAGIPIPQPGYFTQV